jgi:hypothetical protein
MRPVRPLLLALLFLLALLLLVVCQGGSPAAPCCWVARVVVASHRRQRHGTGRARGVVMNESRSTLQPKKAEAYESAAIDKGAPAVILARPYLDEVRTCRAVCLLTRSNDAAKRVRSHRSIVWFIDCLVDRSIEWMDRLLRLILNEAIELIRADPRSTNTPIHATPSQNIGSCARAMLNFGLTDLRIVAPFCNHLTDGARARASGADGILENARVYADLGEAVADLSEVVGTSARQRDMTIRVVSPEQAAGMAVRYVDAL